MGTYLLLFIAGALWDSIITIDVYATVKGRPYVAALTTFALTVLSCTVYSEVFVVEGWQSGRVFALALGSACGTAGVIKFYSLTKRWKEEKP